MKEKMANKIALLSQRKKIALIAHDHKKPDLLEWVRFNKGTFSSTIYSRQEQRAKS